MDGEEIYRIVEVGDLKVRWFTYGIMFACIAIVMTVLAVELIAS